MSSIAVMQPYFLPYLGYYQQVIASEKFVFLDDVTYIKSGWVNRNRILLNNSDHLFSISLTNASSYRAINEIELYSPEIQLAKLVKKMDAAYSKAPFFKSAFDLVKSIIFFDNRNLSEYNKNSIKKVLNYLEIDSKIVESSAVYQNKHLKAQDRIFDICKKEKANVYINSIGGTSLYNKHEFEKHDIELKFIKPLDIEYKQFNERFVPWLSIVDVLMFNSTDTVKQLLNRYTFL